MHVSRSIQENDDMHDRSCQLQLTPKTLGLSVPNTKLYYVYQHNVPCAVSMFLPEPQLFMVPAKSLCPSSGTREYYGYLTTAAGNHRSSYDCVDINPEIVPGTSAEHSFTM